MTSSSAAILPITLTVNDRTGLTLYAPPWEDEDGEQWQGFLGDGAKIVLYPTASALADFIASGEEHDLSDHPGWGQIAHAGPDDLRPDPTDRYDLDEVFELAGDDPDPVHVSKLANIVDMVGRIADVCDDGALRSLVSGTPAYAELVDDEVSYQGKDGRKRWDELGDTIADSWERAMKRVEGWLKWEGDFSETDFGDAAETEWERVGAEPISIVLDDKTYLTVRGQVLVDVNGDETEMAFLGEQGDVHVFTEVADLARYCREATEHRLVKLEWWSELADLAEDDAFAPETTIDLRKPSDQGADLLAQLIDFCDLDVDASPIFVANVAKVNKDDWNDVVAEISQCFTES